jgi:hypothetical protein
MRAVVAELGRGDHSALLAAGWRSPSPSWRRAATGRPTSGGSSCALELRPRGAATRSSSPSTRAPRQPRAQVLLGLPDPGHAPAGGAGLHRGDDRRHGHLEPLEGVPRRGLEEPGRRGLPRPDPLAPGGGRRSTTGTTRPGRDLRGFGRGAERHGGAPLPPGLLPRGRGDNGCHDNRMDKIWWNELWMGKVGPHYDASSNVDERAPAPRGSSS